MKNKIKLIAVDVDGTLLNSDSKISIRNKKAIRKCLDNGIRIILSTGKSIVYVKKIIMDLGLKDPQIVCGGSAIINKDSKILVALKISRKSSIRVIEMARKWDRGCGVGTTDGVVYYEKDHQYLSMLARSGESLVKVTDLMEDNIIENSLLFTITIDERDEFNDFLKLNLENDVKIRRGGPIYLNVLNRNAGKVFGLKTVLKLTGVKKDEVLAIGDSENDLGVIKFAGTGIAMNNSPEIVKKSADFIVSDNDSDGVAEAIDKYIKF